MKILQLVTKRQYRGAEVFAANLSSELLLLGHEIIFAGLYNNDCNILEVRGAKNLDLTKKKTGGFSIELIRNIINLVKKERPDIIQCNGSDTLKYMVAASYFIPRTPIVYRNISVISEWIDGSLKLKLYKNLFKRIDHVTSVGSESIEDLIATLDYPKNQTSVIRRGIPLKKVDEISSFSLRNKLGLQNSDKIVMHIGNFSPEKNHEFLLEIFSDIKFSHPDLKLILVGTGITYENILDNISELGLEKTVFPIGFRKDIPELLAQADVFALCSKVEGVPGVILEAGSQRKPSISTNVGGVKEVLIDNETGYIIDDFDKIEYTRKLIQLLSNKELNSKMGNNAYKLVVEEFNPKKNAKKFESLYEGLLNKGKQIFPQSSEKLKILQIIQKKQFRGAEVFASQLSNQLIDLGQEVEMVAIYEGVAELSFKNDIKSLNREKSQRIFDIRGWKKLSIIINEFKPDIVQANASDTLKYAVLSKLFFNWKTLLVYRNASSPSFYIRSFLARNLNAFLLRKVDLIISVSKTSMMDLNNLFPFTKLKSMVIPVGVDTPSNISTYNKTVVFNSKYNIIHIGSFTREKNHIGLLNIFEKIKKVNPQVHLILIGSGPLEKEIHIKVKELNLEEFVTFLGEIKNPFPYFQESDVLVLPSIIEGLPGVILEAMLCSVPVVAYDVGGISEVVNNDTGYLVPLHEEQQFASTVVSVLKLKEIVKLEKSRKLVLDQYSNQKIAQKFLNQYKLLIKNYNRPI